MAALASGMPDMVESDIAPIFCVGVAEGAVAGVMDCRGVLAVAAFTLCHAGVVIADLSPTGDVGVANGAFAGVVGGRRILVVAGGASAYTQVVVAGDGPIGRVFVAEDAVAGVMVAGSAPGAADEQQTSASGNVLGMAGAAFDDAFVAELVGPPGAGVVAGGAVAGEVLGIDGPEVIRAVGEKMDGNNGRFPRMATGADCRCTGVLPIVVAAFAGHVCMPIGQWENAVIYCLAQKGDQGSLDQARQGGRWQAGDDLGRRVKRLPDGDAINQGDEAFRLAQLQSRQDDIGAAEQADKLGMQVLLLWLGKGVDEANGRYQRRFQSGCRNIHLFGAVSVSQIRQAPVGQPERETGALSALLHQAQPGLLPSMLQPIEDLPWAQRVYRAEVGGQQTSQQNQQQREG